MGGTLGVAVFLFIVYSSAQGKLAHSPAFDALARAHPDQIAKLRSGGTSNSTLNDTSFLNGFNATLTHPFRQGFTSSLTAAFLLGAIVLSVAVVLALLQREVPLRTVGAQQAVAEEAALARDAAAEEAALARNVAAVAGNAADPGVQASASRRSAQHAGATVRVTRSWARARRPRSPAHREAA